MSKNILVINGPNMNMLGIREKEIYGHNTYDDLCKFLMDLQDKNDCKISIFQSNSEGEIVDRIQSAYFDGTDYIVINPASYTHYSIAIRDAILAVNIETVEVHLTDINNRDEFRKISVIKDIVSQRFFGKGFDSYKEAIEYICKKLK